MKKTKKILSVFIAAAMALSMAVMCLPVVNVSAAGTTWRFSNVFVIGASGSAATLKDGPFGLDQNGKVLDSTVTVVNGVASIVSTEGKRAFSASENGIIDITPAAGTRSQIYFTAPEAGEYSFTVEVEKTSMTGLSAGETVKNWVEIGPRTELASSFAEFSGLKGGENYTGKAIGNSDNFNATELKFSGKVTLSAGQVIVLSINAEGNSDETQTTLKEFTVKLGGGDTDNGGDNGGNNGGTTTSPTGATWRFGNAFSIGAVGTTATLKDGPFGLDQSGKTLNAEVTSVNGKSSIVGSNGKRAFSASENGILDITPAAGTRSHIYFTAPEAGEYSFTVELEKTDMSGLPAGETVKNWVEIGPRTELASSFAAFPGLKAGENYTGKAIGNSDDFKATELKFSGKVTLSAGQVIVISVNAEGNSDETQTTLKEFTVKLGDGGEDTDPNVVPGGVKDVANNGDVNDPFFNCNMIRKLHGAFRLVALNGDDIDYLQISPKENEFANLSWYIGDGTKFVFGKARGKGFGDYPIDMIPQTGLSSAIIYTAPENGTYTYNGEFIKLEVWEGTVQTGVQAYKVTADGTKTLLSEFTFEATTQENGKDYDALIGTLVLNAGDQIWFVADVKAGSSTDTEIAVKTLSVKKLTEGGADTDDDSHNQVDIEIDGIRQGMRFKFECTTSQKISGLFKLAGMDVETGAILGLEKEARPAWANNYKGWYLMSDPSVYLFSDSISKNYTIDMSPKTAADSAIIFTAPADGEYRIIGDFAKLSVWSEGSSYKLELIAGSEVIDTEEFTGEINESEQKVLLSGIVNLKKGDTVAFVASHVSGDNQSAEIAVVGIEIVLASLEGEGSEGGSDSNGGQKPPVNTGDSGNDGERKPDTTVIIIAAAVAAVVIAAVVVTVIVIKKKKAK